MFEQFDLIRLFQENTKRNVHYIVKDSDISLKPSLFKEYHESTKIKLPKDSLKLQMTIEEAILQRRSCRNFAGRSMNLVEISRLLWFGYGVIETMLYEGFEIPLRPAPSAGALYPCEIYPVVFDVKGIDNGVYHYCPVDHSLELLKIGDFTNHLIHLFMGQYYIAGSSVCFILTSVLNRTTWKYGERGYRYILLELGHITQNLCLAATAQGLTSLALGGFYDDDLAGFIGVNPKLEPIQYGLAVGYEAEESKGTTKGVHHP